MKNKITILAVSVLILLLTAAALLCGVWFFRSAWYGEAELLSMPYANGMPFLGNTVYANTICELPWGQSLKEVRYDSGDGVFQAGRIKTRTQSISRHGQRKLITVPLKSSRTGKVEPGTVTISVERPFFKGSVRKKSSSTQLESFTVAPLTINDKNQLPLAGELSVPEPATRQYYFWAAGILLLALAIWWVVKKFRRRKVRVLMPWEIARAELVELRRTADLHQQPLAWCVARLTDVVRSYLTLRYHYPVISQTTEEFFTALRRGDSQLNAAQIRYLEDFLSAADLIKFANIRPDQEMFESAVVRAEKLIDETGTTDSDPAAGQP